jgi:hypothetical protein
VLLLIRLLVGLLVSLIRLLGREEVHCCRGIVNVRDGMKVILKINRRWKKLLIMIIVIKNIYLLIHKYL